MNWNSDNKFDSFSAEWEQGTYQTGRTRPCKSHGGLIAVLLVLIIALCGVITVLGVMNIRLFKELNAQSPEETLPISFSHDPSVDATMGTPEPAATQPHTTKETGVSIQLETTPTAVDNVPQSGGLPLQEIYERTIDSVVSISCSGDSGSSSGTGVVLAADGYLVTNAHVVEGAQAIQVQFTDGRVLQAKIVGSDAVSDLAVLWVEAEDLSPAQFGDSGALRVGDSVVAIGDPLGAQLRGTMTDGIVSAINRDITTQGRTMTLIQTNAALNSGNSGGPLLNCYGQVIGINTLKIGDLVNASGVEGLGFAIPATTVKDIVDQLISQGYVSGRPSLGIEGEGISPFYQLYYHLPQGLYITAVTPGSSAEAAGIQDGDILISLDGTRITDPDALKTLLYSYQVGDTVQLNIYRAGKQYSLSIPLDEAK